ncbi:MAG: nitric oxide reductase activation protein NorD [Candidatus Binatia bacterium]
MSADRGWLASGHLSRSNAGADAVAFVTSLDAESRDRVLALGDRIAKRSVTLSHIYLIAAVGILRAAASRFEEWKHCALDVMGDDIEYREAADAFFGLDQDRFMSLPPECRQEWLACSRDLSRRSRRLGAQFVTVTGPVLCSKRPPQRQQIAAWREALTSLVDGGGWRSEFTAKAITASAANLLASLAPPAVPGWVTCVELLSSLGRRARAPEPPAELGGLSPDHQLRVLNLCSRLAAVNPLAAPNMLSRLPRSLSSLPRHGGDDLLSALEQDPSAEGLVESVSLLPALTHALDGESIDLVLSSAPAVAARFPSGLPAYLRTMCRALEEGGREGFELWVRKGAELGERSRDAGQAYFNLQSRTSHKVLVQHTAAVAFEEVEGLIQRYLVMMSRRHFQLTSSPGVWYRPPLYAPDDTALQLPERVDLCDNSEDNQLFYKLTAAHFAGRWEYGTYDFNLDWFRRLGWRPPGGAGEEPEGDDVVSLLNSYPNPLLASALFVLLEGARIDSCIEREFAGLAEDMDRLGRHYAANPPLQAPDRPAESLLEALFHMTVGRRSAAGLAPRLRAFGRSLAPALDLLRSEGATVYDSAALFCGFYSELSLADARAVDEEEAVAIEAGGATVIDPLEHLEYGGSGSMPTAGDDEGGQDTRDESVSGEQDLSVRLDDTDDHPGAGARPLSAEEIRRLLEEADDLLLSESRGQEQASLGLYITDLLGKLPAQTLADLRTKLAAGDVSGVRRWLNLQSSGASYRYDEWDYLISDYRKDWCRLSELVVDGDGGEYFHRVLAASGELIQMIKHEFQRMKPDQYRKVRGMEDGEDFDLNALIDAHAERRSRRSPTDRYYVARRRQERDVATLFLVDMSASTDEPLKNEGGGAHDPGLRCVIDLFKETLVVMSEVLEDIGDSYAMYGFSGHGRDNVEYFHVKAFSERLTARVKSRVGGITPKRSTRMGAALRHSAEKLSRVTARSRHLILLSDGFPQDHDYGDDRRSNTYGLRDTATALREVENLGVKSFCITVDPAGHDYLRDMCPTSRYAIIENIEELPEELTRIYRRVTRL